jgi:hypothetical protein
MRSLTAFDPLEPSESFVNGHSNIQERSLPLRTNRSGLEPRASQQSHGAHGTKGAPSASHNKQKEAP